jgi:hypothetical protein
MLILVIDLSHPRKKLAEEIDYFFLKAKMKGYSTKKLYSIVPLLLSQLSISDASTVKVFEKQLSSDFIYSMVLPIIELIKCRADVTFFVKYTVYKLKNYQRI